MKKYSLAIVGATGLVGRTFLSLLKESHFPIKTIRLFASKKSVGKTFVIQKKKVVVQTLSEHAFDHMDVVFFSAGSEIAKIWAPKAVQKGALVIDNSSYFRNEREIPLVVPEINFADIQDAKIIANPNCSTIPCMAPLFLLHQLFHLKLVHYATYQSVSGSGQKGLEELQEVRNGAIPLVYPYSIAKTVIPEIGKESTNHFTEEEMKMVHETRKILHLPSLEVSATCVRVPVPRGHSVEVYAQCEKPVDISKWKEALSSFPGIQLCDDLKNHLYPHVDSLLSTDDIAVGRIRIHPQNPRIVLFFVAVDNIRKGAAGNAFQILIKLLKLK